MDYHLIIDTEIGPWGCSKRSVRNFIEKHGKGHIDVKITSPGGRLDDAFDIRQQFIDHGDVTVYISAFAASSATVIAMGAKKVVMYDTAHFMVHKCSNFLDVWGSYNADQMQKLIDDLEANKKENDKIDVTLASMYAKKCGKKVADILDILKKGGWLTAKEAKDIGFVDEVASGGASEKFEFTDEVVARFNAIGLTPPVQNATAEDRSLIERVAEKVCRMLRRKGDDERDDKSGSDMKNFKFNSVEDLLAADKITPDKDGMVTMKAEDLQKINDRISSMEAEAKTKDGSIESMKSEVAALKEQVKNLEDGAGDETGDIEDEEGKTGRAFSASELFNSVKDID